MEGVVATELQMWLTFAVIFSAVLIYSADRWPLEMVSAGVIGVLMLLFQFMPVIDPVTGQNQLDAGRLIEGFANEALMAIIALLIIGQGMYQAGALEGPTQRLTLMLRGRPKLSIIVVLLIAGIISAFLNNTPVAVMFIPIMSAVAARSDMNVSKVMIPLSYVCVLGGMTTLIGSSTNLLVAETAAASAIDASQRAALDIGFFDLTVPGLVLASVGFIYIALVLPRTLPDRASLSGEMGGASGRQYIAQIDLTFGHSLIGKKAVAGLFPDLKNMTVRMVQRRENAILPPFEGIELELGDAVIVAATRKTLTGIISSQPKFLSGIIDHQDDSSRLGGQALTMIEAVVAPGSRMIGRNIQQIGFRYQTGCIVLGIQRRSRMIRVRMNEIRLEDGDVLLIFGTQKNIQGLRASRDILPLEWSSEELPDITNAFRARLIFGMTIAAAATGLLPIVVSAMVGAFAMVAAGCLNIRQAARAFDRRIYLLVGAALAMGTSMQVTGGAMYLAHTLVEIFADFSTPVLLSAFFLMVALLTNVLSNNATAVLFTPIAVTIAVETGVDPRAFVFAVIFAANCSFATPMAYQTNLLVMGPGHYKFADYVKAGTPLIFIMWIIFSLFAPWYFGIS
jgi:di/tricarboxylate transporter